MIKADEKHKGRVKDLLADCFASNKSVNYIVKQDEKRMERVRALIDYSFDFCINSDGVYLTDDLSGVVISHHSDDKLPVFEEWLLTFKFIFRVSGITGIDRALKREKYIKSFHPQDQEYIYIWFIGVDASQQGKGVGSQLLQHMIDKSVAEQIPVYLETSVEKNLPFYQKHGFEVFHVEEKLFDYKLYFLRRKP